MYKKIFFDLLLSCICFIPNKAIRIPLDIDLRTSPFLQSTSSTVQSSVPKIVKAPFTWSHNYLGKLLHQANIVEIGPRGALFILYDNTQEDDTKDLKVEYQSTINQNQTLCLPSKKALCMITNEEGEVLPSAFFLMNGGTLTTATAAPGSSVTFNITASEHIIQDSVLKSLWHLMDGCKLEGNGGYRIYNENYNQKPYYTVTACDVLQGTHVLVYEPRTRKLKLYEQSFGPIAYILILISAAMHVAMLALYDNNKIPEEPSIYGAFQGNCLLSVIACFILYIKGEVHFHIREDEILFGISCIYTLAALLRKRIEAYLFALNIISAAVYNTYETPYSGIIAYVLGFKVWVQMLQLSKPMMNKNNNGMIKNTKLIFFLLPLIEFFFLLIYIGIFCEIAVKPLFIMNGGGLWKLHFVFHIFIVYSLAKYKDLSTIELQ